MCHEQCRKARRRWGEAGTSVRCLQEAEQPGGFPLLGEGAQGAWAAPVSWTLAAALPALSLHHSSSPSGSDALCSEGSI